MKKRSKVIRRHGFNPSPAHPSQKRMLQETFVYLMMNFPFFFVNKFGISDKTRQRRRNVSETTPGAVGVILSVNLAFGYDVEQFVHWFYRFLNLHFWTGSGRTEWFICFSPIIGALTCWLNIHFNFGLSLTVLMLSFFTPFIWWDGLFWLILFKSIKVLIGISFIFLAIYLVAHLK